MVVLFTNAGIDINVRRTDPGYTPLMEVAMKKGNMELIKALKMKGADAKLYAADGSSLLQVNRYVFARHG